MCQTGFGKSIWRLPFSVIEIRIDIVTLKYINIDTEMAFMLNSPITCSDVNICFSKRYWLDASFSWYLGEGYEKLLDCIQ